MESESRRFTIEEGRKGPRPDGQIRDIIEVMLGTATRIGETLALRKCDVDMADDPPSVPINGTVLVKTRVGVVRQPHPKTNESNRVVGVPPFAAEVIRHGLALIAGEDDEHPIFFTSKGTLRAPHNVRRTFRAILMAAGLEGMDITTHPFRRTGATLLANELGLQAAADMLGHTSTSTTREHHAEPDRTVKSEPAAVLQRWPAFLKQGARHLVLCVGAYWYAQRMAEPHDLNTDFSVVADHLDAIARPLTYDEFVYEISVAAPASSDIHWMADNQLVNIFFARRTAAPSLLTERIRSWIR